MKFEEKIKQFYEQKTKCFVNGMPTDTEITKEGAGGKIIGIEEDYIVFQIFNNTEKQTDITIETINIPKAEIKTLSEIKKPSTL